MNLVSRVSSYIEDRVENEGRWEQLNKNKKRIKNKLTTGIKRTDLYSISFGRLNLPDTIRVWDVAEWVVRAGYYAIQIRQDTATT